MTYTDKKIIFLFYFTCKLGKTKFRNYAWEE